MYKKGEIKIETEGMRTLTFLYFVSCNKLICVEEKPEETASLPLVIREVFVLLIIFSNQKRI